MGELAVDDLESATLAATRGETGALRSVYQELSPRVCAYLRARGAEDPEDLTNEVFIRVLTRIADLSGGYSGLRALTFTVAHGLLVDELRQRGRRPVSHTYDVVRDLRTSSSAEDQALEHLGHGAALELLGLLPDDQRSVILLRVVGELTTDETAAAIGRSRAAVKKLQAKALDSLRRLLGSEQTGATTHDDEVGR